MGVYTLRNINDKGQLATNGIEGIHHFCNVKAANPKSSHAGLDAATIHIMPPEKQNNYLHTSNVLTKLRLVANSQNTILQRTAFASLRIVKYLMLTPYL